LAIFAQLTDENHVFLDPERGLHPLETYLTRVLLLLLLLVAIRKV
jgi:hypothetical protein